MATLKGAIRSYGAAVRRAEREQQRRAREAARRYKEQQKQEEIQDAATAVRDYNNYIELIQSVHKHCTEEVDWILIKTEPKPTEPKESFSWRTKAIENLNNFRPSFFDKLFGLTNKKTTALEDQVLLAEEKDSDEYELALTLYKGELAEWNFLQELMIGLEKGTPESYRDAIQYFDPFSDIGELGSSIQFSIDDNQIDVDVHINSEEAIPDYELKQTARGTLSKKNMTKSKFNELYQDHICSAILRVSRELFAYLPVKKARVNAIGLILNSATGHLEERPILSAIMVPDTINILNMETIDPSDSLQNFIHNMKFSRTKGFSPVEKVKMT